MKLILSAIFLAALCYGLHRWLTQGGALQCPDEVSDQALTVVYSRLGDSPGWWDDSRLDDIEPRVAAFRRWAETVQDRCARAAYLEWMDYYEHELADAREENRTHRLQRESDEYRAKEDQRKARVRALDAERPIAIPPVGVGDPRPGGAR